MLSALDWGIVAAYLTLSLAIGLYFSKRASRGLESFFLGGRSLPGWLAGLSMVATTFATDTPLFVADVVRRQGIAGNWLWWSMLLGGMFTTFFFAKLWRRAGVLTDLELITLRYAGRPAKWLRGIRAAYLGVFLNCIIIGWVNLALRDILIVIFPELSPEDALGWVAACMALTVLYSSLSGLIGVVVTDAVQFTLAMGGCVVLAFVVVNSPEIGGLEGLVAKSAPERLQLLPAVGPAQGVGGGSFALGIGAFLAMVCIQWYASWFPGAEPGGGGYIAQRMMATRSERQALISSFFFNAFHYAVRPWPWILVGLCAVVLYPQLPVEEGAKGFVYAMKDYLPTGLLGLLFAAFLAAYMSTISTQLNWGVSYLVADLYKPYLLPNRSERHYVAMSRIATVGLMLVSLIITLNLDSISSAWTFLIDTGAGLGLVLILRWYWWRVNSWSEIAAMLLPLLLLPLLKLCMPNEGFWGDRTHFVWLFAATTVVWLVVTLLTPPEPRNHLLAFAQRVRPQGFWKPIWVPAPDAMPATPLYILALAWLSGCGMVYGLLIGVGGLLLSQSESLGIGFGAALLSALVLVFLSRKWKLL